MVPNLELQIHVVLVVGRLARRVVRVRRAARVDDGRRGAVLERTAVAEVVRVAVVPLRLEADFTGEAGEAVLLLEEGLLGGEDRLRVRLGLALLRARLELDEVRDGDGREDADD